MSEMTADEYGDLVSQMHVLVLEETPAWEIELGGADLFAAGRVMHGPWPRSDCARVLSRWAQAGLVTITREEGWPGRNAWELRASEAAEVLSDPERWSSEPVGESSVWWSLVATDRGMAADVGEWLAHAPQQRPASDS